MCGYSLELPHEYPLHLFLWRNMSHDMTKLTKWVCAKRRLRSAWASAQSDQESLLGTQWVAKDPRFLHADSEHSDQTGRMPRLIWVLAAHTLILLVLSCHGSYGQLSMNYHQIPTQGPSLGATEAKYSPWWSKLHPGRLWRWKNFAWHL